MAPVLPREWQCMRCGSQGCKLGQKPCRALALGSFACCYDRTPDKRHLVGLALTQSRHGGQAWLQEPETAGHSAASVRKRKEMNRGARLHFSIYSVQGDSPWMAAPVVGERVFPVNPIWKSLLRHAPDLNPGAIDYRSHPPRPSV